MRTFVRDLLLTGRPQVMRADRLTDVEWSELRSEVATYWRQFLRTLPGSLPPAEHDLSNRRQELAAGAVAIVYAFCQGLAFRELEASEIEPRLGRLPRTGRAKHDALTPLDHLAVDFGLRYLASLDTRLAAMNAADPLRESLQRLAAAYPLSGSLLTDPPESETVLAKIVADPVVWRLWCDRRLETYQRHPAGVSRNPPSPREIEELPRRLGDYPDLVPSFADALRLATP